MPSSSSEKVLSILEYYQSHHINPVPIKIEDAKVWESHQIKRRNLYEQHLKVPLAFFRDHSVIEFGCNSGENALYLGAIGARLTLVEPNDQVLPRLSHLFKKFKLENSIEELANTDISGFDAKGRQYDVMLAEGFLTMIPERAQMLMKICGLIAPGGYGIISFDDRYGSLFEVMRQMIYRRVCEMKGIKDLHSDPSLAAAKELFGEDFSRLNASRPFEAWWQDVLLNRYVSWEHLGTYQEFVPLLEKANCEIHSTSPVWSLVDHYCWYKNVSTTSERHQHFLQDWYRAFPFSLMGLPLTDNTIKPATPQAVEGVSEFIRLMSAYNFSKGVAFESVSYPSEMEKYLRESNNARMSSLNTDIKGMLDVLKKGSPEQTVAYYKSTACLRNSWGMAGPYISFKKLF
jgi:SAM-dependent methyltransferase